METPSFSPAARVTLAAGGFSTIAVAGFLGGRGRWGWAALTLFLIGPVTTGIATEIVDRLTSTPTA